MSKFVEDRSVLTRPASAPDELLSYGELSGQVADVRFGGEHAAQRPLVILFHGGFWRPEYDRTHTRPMAEAIARAGWTIAIPEYRRIPKDPDATLSDVALAVATLPNKIKQHSGQVLLLGHSAGGHLILWAAAKSNDQTLRGSIALAPVADLQMAYDHKLDNNAVFDFIGTSPQNRGDIDPNRLPNARSPIYILHGEEDDIVPLACSEAYKMNHPQTALTLVTDCGHFGLIDPESKAWPQVIAALNLR